MRERAIKFKYAVVAVIFATLAAFTCFIGFAGNTGKASADAVATLVLSNDEKTVTGLTVEGDGDFTVTIPASVEEIADYAFVGKSELKGITFANSGNLKKIGNFALAGTGISKLALPEGLTSVGIAAVADCENLRYVSLPSTIKSIETRAFGNSKITALKLPVSLDDDLILGSEAFDTSVSIVANSLAQYKALSASDSPFADYCTGDTDSLTYLVTIEYYYYGDSWEGVNTPVDTEIKLFGRDYGYALINGVWVENGKSYVGTAALGGDGTQWHRSVDSAEAVTIEAMTAALAVENTVTIKLYASSLNADNSFVARTDLVYNGVEFPVSAINALLTPSSKKVTTETVTITNYVDFDGTSGTKTSFKDAGTYTVSISGDVLTIVIDRATINLSSSGSLVWRAVDGNSTATLLDRTVYLYTTMGGDKKYPSLSRLDDDQKLLLGLANDEPETVEVVDSITRLHGATLSLVENGFSATYETTKGEADEIGVYTTAATLTADKNHLFVYGGSVFGGTERGLKVTLDANGIATVEKVWYVADMNNWFVFAGGTDYAVPTHVYGEQFAVVEPRLAYGHDTYFGGAEPKTFTYELTYINGNSRETNQFADAQFETYMNAAIPAGEYELKIIAEAFNYVEIDYAEDGVTEVNRREVHCDKFDQTFEFTVIPGTMSPDAVKKINDLLFGARFEYILTEPSTSAVYESAMRSVAAALEEAVEPISGLPADNFWASEQYVGVPSIVVNRASDMTNSYGALVKPTTAGVYNYYYKIVCKNYADVSEEDGELLTMTVAAFAYVDLPSGTVLSKPYTGSLLTADIDAGTGGGFTVTQNNGGVSVGEYNVVLTLTDPDCHLWAGKSLVDADRSAARTLRFNITKATNDWIVKPTLQNWITGRFDESENGIIGSALFGYDTMHYIVTTTTKDEKVLFDSRKDEIGKLASLGVGDYALTVVIGDCNDYTGVETSTIFHIFKKPGLAWWAVLLIVLGSLAVAALIIFILWKKGVFSILTNKIIVAIRTRASVEATIASVRAAKMMEEGKRSVAEAKRKEAARERAAARRAERELPEEERAKAIEVRAAAAEQRAEKMRAKAEAMRKQAELMREKAAASASEQSQAQSEAAATDAPSETPTEE